jgi:hypothetical protein
VNSCEAAKFDQDSNFRRVLELRQANSRFVRPIFTPCELSLIERRKSDFQEDSPGDSGAAGTVSRNSPTPWPAGIAPEPAFVTIQEIHAHQIATFPSATTALK